MVSLAAIGFSYFEKLVETGNQATVEGEIARLVHFNQMLLSVGGYHNWENFADECINLLAEVSHAMSNPGTALRIIIQRWNDVDASNGIIIYFRMLSATFLKMNATIYDPLLAVNHGVADCFSTNIELANTQVETMGLVALVHVLLKPTNFVLEIAHLDRTQGKEANVYHFLKEANGQDRSALGTAIYLLYRVNHYDVLYRSPPRPATNPAALAPDLVPLQVYSGFIDNAAISTQTDLDIYSKVDLETLAMNPVFGTSSPTMSPVTSYMGPHISEPFSPGWRNPWAPQSCDGFAAAIAAAAPPSPSPQPPPQPHPFLAPVPLPNSSAPMSPRAYSTMGTQPGVERTTSLTPSLECAVRFSPMQLEYDDGMSNYPEPAFLVTTNTFKNSVWNRAHFCNPDFHPEEWTPEDGNVNGHFVSRKTPK
jgi:ubiquitin thioesterase protein OTUB1